MRENSDQSKAVGRRGGGASSRRKLRQKGSEILEFGLVMVPMLAIVFVIIDISWAIFARSTLQYAVREGCRYAVTSQTSVGFGHVDSIKKVVQHHAMGILPGPTGLDKVKVRFFNPDTLVELTGAGSNAGGNIVEVAIEGVSWSPLAPLLRDKGPIRMSARSLDRMEASPPSGVPAL